MKAARGSQQLLLFDAASERRIGSVDIRSWVEGSLSPPPVLVMDALCSEKGKGYIKVEGAKPVERRVGTRE